MVQNTENLLFAIQSVTTSVFGECQIWLFGSRTDDAKKGGDMDLLVVAPTEAERGRLMRLEMSFLVQLKEQIGEQKIDLVFATEESLLSDPFLQCIKDKIRL